MCSSDLPELCRYRPMGVRSESDSQKPTSEEDGVELVSTKPRLSDVEFEKKYESGDRILVRSSAFLNQSQARRIFQQINQALKVDLRIIILPIPAVRATIDKADGSCQVMVGSEHLDLVKDGNLNVGAAKVDFDSGDKVTVVVRGNPGKKERDRFEENVRDWVGPDHEVLILWGMDF